jgi:hypothetical protein
MVNAVAIVSLLDKFDQCCREGGLLIAHVCDCHLLQGKPIDASDPKHQQDHDACPNPDLMPLRLAEVVSELNALRPRPHFVLFGGDMTERGRPIEWDDFFRIAAGLNIPYFLTLGNHDHDEESDWSRSREALCRGLRSAGMCRTPPEAVTDGGLYHSARHGSWRLLVVDSLFDVPLDGVQRDWLARALSSDGTPTILSMHRPFVKVGNAMDRYRMRDPELLRLIIESGCVRVILSGHTHKRRACSHAKITHLVSPTIQDAIDDTPGYRLLCLHDGGVALTANRELAEHAEVAPDALQLDKIEPCDDI